MRKFIISMSVLWTAPFAMAAIERPKAVDASLVAILQQPPDVRQRRLEDQPRAVYHSLLDIALRSEQPMNVRWRALTSAARLRRSEAIPDLKEALRSGTWFVRNAALVSLADFAPDEAIKAGRELIQDPALVVRSAAVDVLVTSPAAGDRALLWKELEAPRNRKGRQSLWIRSQIASGLLEKAGVEDVPRFARLLDDRDERLQKIAVNALEKLTEQRPASGIASHARVVEIWKDFVNRPSAKLLQ